MVGGSGLRPRLPWKSRLKTAPTIQKQPIQNYKVLYLIDWPLFKPAAALNTDPLAAENLQSLTTCCQKNAAKRLRFAG
jgi:hypothetical protein